MRHATEHDREPRAQEKFASLQFQISNVEETNYRRPSSPFISAIVRPPTRGSGLPLSVIATATMISLARGASLICTSMPSKWLRTNAASLWPSGMFRIVPIPHASWKTESARQPLPSIFAHRRAHLGMQDRGRVFELAVFADRRCLAVALRFCPSCPAPPLPSPRAIREFLANRDQEGKIFDIFSGETDFRLRQWRPRAGSAVRRPFHLQQSLLDDRDDFTNDCASSLSASFLDIHHTSVALLWRPFPRSKHLSRRHDHSLAMYRNAAPSIIPQRALTRLSAPASSACSISTSDNSRHPGHKARAKIAVGLQILCRTADNGGCPGKSPMAMMVAAASACERGPRQYGDGVGDAERETAPWRRWLATPREDHRRG